MYDLQRLAAMDDCEHATGKTLAQHVKERRTAKDVIALEICHSMRTDISADDVAADAIKALGAAGYRITQVVQTGNKPWERA
jgi:hypothetical protein